MNTFHGAISSAIQLIMSGDAELFQIIFRSLRVSLTALALGTLIAVPLGTIMGLKKFPGRGLLVTLVYTFMGFPPVLAGLIVYLLLSNQGPLGWMQLLFTPTAMVIAQTILVVPIISGLTMVGVMSKDKLCREVSTSLGANSLQVAFTVLWEARGEIGAAIITGFGRVVAEVGAVMMVGGNIKGFTRVMTTAIVLETRKGNFQLALALGLILMFLSFVITFGLRLIQGEVTHGKRNAV